jgi:hypothetical protein
MGGSNPDFWRNRKFAEFFAVYRENRVFRPHRQIIDLPKCRTTLSLIQSRWAVPFLVLIVPFRNFLLGLGLKS